jgi:hypothetical protein
MTLPHGIAASRTTCPSRRSGLADWRGTRVRDDPNALTIITQKLTINFEEDFAYPG